ncbi:PRD domain-containing protein [Rothia nasimurium]|uniref:PRD domain-containing protein n=1 Tax=Rothia nasimurium TaxID=85336 RepID=UPI001EFF7CB3|nr:PRD domain-containing protein [Rothia nasimurium]
MLRISRIYNNNVALARSYSGEEMVVIGRGLAFGKRKGDMLDPTLIEQTFVPEQGTSDENLAWSLAKIPSEILAVATELEALVKAEGITVAHSFVVPVADHVNFAVERARNSLEVDYPLALEVRQLYPQEVRFGERALQLIRERLGVDLPEIEAIPLAMHLVNSQFESTGMAGTYRMTEIFAEIFEVIGAGFGGPMDRSLMSAARFVTHLRYLFVRASAAQAADPGTGVPLLLESMKDAHPKAFAVAVKVKLVLENHLGQVLTDDELTYLTIHIARLARDQYGTS